MRSRSGRTYRASLLLAALAALAALVALPGLAAAQAQGVALRWNRCHGETGAAILRDFACNTNAGFELLVGSFAVGTDVAQMNGLEIVVDVYTYSGQLGFPSGGPLPAWWQFKNTGSCRLTSLSIVTFADPTDQVCQWLWNGQEVGAIAAYRLDVLGPGTARILAVAAVPAGAEVQAQAGVPYEAFTLRINHSRTVGAGACDGCLVPMQLLFRSLRLTTPLSADDRILSGGLEPLSDAVLWATSPVPTRRSTWGAVRALYR